MPYIKQEQRAPLDALIDNLAGVVVEVAGADGPPFDSADFAGVLNYTITRLVMQVINVRFGVVRYHVVATVSGVLTNVATELYRRVWAPYEDKCITKNGDLPLFDKLAK